MAGLYAMNLMINGEMKTVIVDDYIPVVDGTTKPAFSSSRNGNAWVLLLEKAWAKLHGSYESIIAGCCSDVFNFFTPYPTKHYNTLEERKDYEEEKVDLWNRMKNGHVQGHLMTCGTSGHGEQEQANGLLSGHAYTILEALEIDDG